MLAGNVLPNRSGSASDGTGINAGFWQPQGMATDSSGNMYVADTANCTIRKITPAAAVTTLAGTAGVCSFNNDIGGFASFRNPAAVATDNAGNLYVADTNNNAVRKIVIATGATTTLAAGLSGPRGLISDSNGNVYVANTVANTINKITPLGVVSLVAGSAVAGASNGAGVAATFNGPVGLSIDGTGNLYVTETGNNDIRKITPATVAASAVVSTYATGLSGPIGLTGDGAGNLYAANSTNNTINKIAPPVGAASAVVSLVAGSSVVAAGYVNGTGAAALFNAPFGVTVDSTGNLYVAEVNNNDIRKITSSGVVSAFAGIVNIRGSADGTGMAATFGLPGGGANRGAKGMVADSAGNVYVVDTVNNKIRKITPAGVVTTLAGSGAAGSSNATAGNALLATFNLPNGLAIDSSGNIYVSEKGNNDIRKITPAGAVSTLAAGFNMPHGMVVDSSGNVYLADTRNCLIKKITPATAAASSVMSTVAGSGICAYADGAGAAASFNFPEGLVIDGAGNLYVADNGNRNIRKIAPATASASAVVSTVAGVPVSGFADGTGAAARFSAPSHIAIDGSGNLYVADKWNYAIRKITPAGVVTTVMGNGTRANSTQLALNPLRGSIDGPTGIAVSGNTLYVYLRAGVVAVSPLP